VWFDAILDAYMLEIILVGLLALLAVWSTFRSKEADDIGHKIGEKLDRLWDITHQSMRENKMLRAEKALLTILKIDQKNAAAYNRLGILYAKQKEFKDAIDCFEIASTLEASASSLHNLGLIYYETGEYSKAVIAFREALDYEDELASRHIAFAKALEKVGDDKRMISELERAVELEPNKETLNLLLAAYEAKSMEEEVETTKKRIEKLIVTSSKASRVLRPRKVVV
jgi:tetratricopeptide (TPR) repeat protein